MKTCFTYAFILSTLLWCMSAFGINKNTLEILTCDSPACESVAKRVEYRYEKAAHTITLKTEHFSLEIPDKPIRKIVSTRKDLIILYSDDKLLYFCETTGPEIKGASPESAYRYPEILFTKTPQEIPPKSPVEQLLWNTALASKPFYFQGATEVPYTKNNDLTYYLTNTHELGFSARAMVTHAKHKHIFLAVEAKQMDFDSFKQVVYSVK